jgi:hypothetical protein
MHEFSELWAVHCEKDECPVFLAWAPSEKAAKERLQQLKAQAGEELAGTEYWVVQMTRGEVEDFKEAGVIPQDA